MDSKMMLTVNKISDRVVLVAGGNAWAECQKGDWFHFAMGYLLVWTCMHQLTFGVALCFHNSLLYRTDEICCYLEQFIGCIRNIENDDILGERAVIVFCWFRNLFVESVQMQIFIFESIGFLKQTMQELRAMWSCNSLHHIKQLWQNENILE